MCCDWPPILSFCCAGPEVASLLKWRGIGRRIGCIAVQWIGTVRPIPCLIETKVMVTTHDSIADAHKLHENTERVIKVLFYWETGSEWWEALLCSVECESVCSELAALLSCVCVCGAFQQAIQVFASHQNGKRATAGPPVHNNQDYTQALQPATWTAQMWLCDFLTLLLSSFLVTYLGVLGQPKFF